MKYTQLYIHWISLGPDGLPLLTSLSHSIGFPPDEEEWIDKDYVELPKPSEETISVVQYRMKK